MRRFFRESWKCRFRCRSRILASAWRPWPAPSGPPSRTGASWSLTAFCRPKTPPTTSESFSFRTCVFFWKFLNRSARRLVQSGNDADHFAHNLGFVRKHPGFRSVARHRMGLHHQFVGVAHEPTAPVALPYVHQVHGPIVFGMPAAVFNVPHLGI